MKLYQLAQDDIVTEGHVDPNVLMAIDGIVARDGKPTNTFDYVAVARLLTLLKDGTFFSEQNPMWCNMNVSKDLLDTLRAMPPKHMLRLAQRIQAACSVKNVSDLHAYTDPSQDMLAWLTKFNEVPADAKE